MERIVAPSILACNYLNLKEDIERINNSAAKWIHFDVMDSHFVPNLTFGPDIFKVFKENSPLFLDVHIMVSNPQFVAQLFLEQGAHQIVFHIEAIDNEQAVLDLIKLIKSYQAKVGIALKPKTSYETIIPYLALIDLVLIMSVEPGFGGQSFDESVLAKAQKLNNIRKDNQYNYLIQIDGGIDHTNKERCYQAGIDCLVSGSYLFKQADFSKAVLSLL
ncbi:MAG: ribulose-phosphate 3-epimerase [Bacilli bacterium]